MADKHSSIYFFLDIEKSYNLVQSLESSRYYPMYVPLSFFLNTRTTHINNTLLL